MMLSSSSAPDKQRLWQHITETLSESIDPGLFFMLRQDAYLDSLELGKAVIAVRTESLQVICEKKLARSLQKVFAETLNRPVTLSIVLGGPRIIEKRSNQAFAGQDTSTPESSAELALPHRQYGDIMGIVDNHPVFRQASLPLTQGGWGIFPQVLTNACKDYGVLTILDGLRDTASRTQVRNPRAFFLSALKRGDYGYKLARGASIIGPTGG